jgi:hypothetical protein
MLSCRASRARLGPDAVVTISQCPLQHTRPDYVHVTRNRQVPVQCLKRQTAAYAHCAKLRAEQRLADGFSDLPLQNCRTGSSGSGSDCLNQACIKTKGHYDLRISGLLIYT